MSCSSRSSAIAAREALDDSVQDTLRVLRESYVELIVVGLPGAEHAKLFPITRDAGAVLRMLDGEPSSAWRQTSNVNLAATVLDLRG